MHRSILIRQGLQIIVMIMAVPSLRDRVVAFAVSIKDGDPLSRIIVLMVHGLPFALLHVNGRYHTRQYNIYF
jgi:hypothetical protein